MLHEHPGAAPLWSGSFLLTLGPSFGIFSPVAIVRILSLDTKVAIEDAPIDPLSQESGNGMRFSEYRGRMRPSSILDDTLNHERSSLL
jgi:hypothetical protein